MMRQTNRRRFLYGMGAAALVAPAWWARNACERRDPMANGRSLEPFVRRAWALGSDVSMTVLHHNADHASRALDAAFGELALVEDVMSIYRENSQLSQLNARRILHQPHSHFLTVLRYASDMSYATGGAFDITIQPLWALFADVQQRGELPSATEVASARQLVDWRRVEYDEHCVRLHGAGTQITLNGIAQGFAADCAMRVLRDDFGIRHALIDTGELGALGRKPDAGGWTVGIQHPRAADAFAAVARLDSRCIATSGDYATTFSEDRTHHHLFDPRTGYSPRELASVSIVANSALQADALSTAVFIMGFDRGWKFVQSEAGIDAMFVDKTGNTRMTAGFPAV